MTAMLPPPVDDGLADHLVGARLPSILLRSTSGEDVDVATFATGRWVLFIYPRTGVPDHAEPDGWELIPGAKGCTAEACSFRDNLTSLQDAGAERVVGLSVQDTDHQREAVARLHLPYPLLSDASRKLADAIRLPTFEAAGIRLLKRMTLVIDGDLISKVFYPVFPVETHVEDVREWISGVKARKPSAETAVGAGGTANADNGLRSQLQRS
jgi:peroxiredoxin